LPQVFEAVVGCRALTIDSERLACYDRSVAALASAREKQDIVVADRATLRETKRGALGSYLAVIGRSASIRVMRLSR
jgi:hypothetical protein